MAIKIYGDLCWMLDMSDNHPKNKSENWAKVIPFHITLLKVSEVEYFCCCPFVCIYSFRSCALGYSFCIVWFCYLCLLYMNAMACRIHLACACAHCCNSIFHLLLILAANSSERQRKKKQSKMFIII